MSLGGVRRRAIAALGAGALAATAGRAQSQPGTGAVRGARGEARIDGIVAAVGSVQAGAGIVLPAGTYLRVALVAAAGRTLGPAPGFAGRLDGLVRFLLDPLAESRHGVYAFGGISGMQANSATRPRVVAGVGVEGPASGGRVLALELALGGGLRIGAAVRAVPRGSR